MHSVNHEHLKKHIAEHEYIEGPQATENFNRVATAVFQSKKTVAPPAKAAPKKRVSRPKKGRVKP
jgi:hypothetical protein